MNRVSALLKFYGVLSVMIFWTFFGYGPETLHVDDQIIRKWAVAYNLTGYVSLVCAFGMGAFNEFFKHPADGQ